MKDLHLLFIIKAVVIMVMGVALSAYQKKRVMVTLKQEAEQLNNF